MLEFLGINEADFFGNPTAFWAAFLVVPIILLYLLRPRPQVISIPSLMFLRKIEKSRRLQSFFTRLVRDPILIFQIIIILLLVGSLAGPFTQVRQSVNPEEEVVIVIDASASMKAKDGAESRFDAALDVTRQIIGGLDERDFVSIVVAESVPATALVHGKPFEATSAMGRLKPADTPTNLGDSILLAKDLLAETELQRVIYVVSDFAGESVTKAELAKKIAAAQAIEVSFIQVGSNEASNIAITAFEAKRSLTDRNRIIVSASVENFGSVDVETSFFVYTFEKELASETRMIKAGGEEFFYYQFGVGPEEQRIRAELTDGGALSSDDVSYSYVSGLRQYKIALLSYTGKDRFLRYVLESPLNNQVDIFYPPIIPDLSAYDIIILGSVSKENLLPGATAELLRQVRSGTNILFVGSNDLGENIDSNLAQILPVTLGEVITQDLPVKQAIEHEMLKDVTLKNIVVKKYFSSQPRQNATTLLLAGNNSLVTYFPFGGGKAMYMGLNPESDWSNFYHSASFPVFWVQVIEFIDRLEDQPTQLNLRTGEIVTLLYATNITTPAWETIPTGSVYLDEIGFYRAEMGYGPETFSASMLNGLESDLKLGEVSEEVGIVAVIVDELEEIRREHYWILCVICILFLFAEALVLKGRGKL
ncbi:MAG: BatA and WFA domain-containing protein [Candidatus Altiarchaeota archaeon]